MTGVSSVAGVLLLCIIRVPCCATAACLVMCCFLVRGSVHTVVLCHRLKRHTEPPLKRLKRNCESGADQASSSSAATGMAKPPPKLQAKPKAAAPVPTVCFM